MAARSAEEAEQVRKLFGIKVPTGLMVAKWILGDAFGLDVKRRDPKPGRRYWDQIMIAETTLLAMQTRFGSRVGIKKV